MKTTNFKGTYVAPAIEVESIYVEKGFAASGDTTNPGWDWED